MKATGLVTNEVQNGASLARSYDSLGRPTGYTLSLCASASPREDFAYDPIGNRVSSTDYDETGAARTSLYTANSLNQYTARAVPGWASVRGLADAADILPPHLAPFWTFCHRPLDLEAMRRAAEMFVGRHRTARVETAPSRGLSLWKVFYGSVPGVAALGT